MALDKVPLATTLGVYTNQPLTKKKQLAGTSVGFEKAVGPKFSSLSTDERATANTYAVGCSQRKKLNEQLGTCPIGHEEDPALLQQKFGELDAEVISSLSKSSASDSCVAAYKLAQANDPAYVSNRSFLIDFLRAERYDAKKAAHRLFRYLSEKSDLFGSDKLTQDICLEDIGEDGLAFLKLGGLQILPERDAAGRRVVFQTLVLPGSDHLHFGARKAYFYFWTSMVEDDGEAGKVKGVVGVMWKFSKQPAPNASYAKAISEIMECCPTKISTYHLCYQQVSFDAFVGTIQNFERLRYLQAHHLPPLECQNRLFSQYGCPSALFPLNYGSIGMNYLHLRFVNDWIIYRKGIDAKKKKLKDTTKPEAIKKGSNKCVANTNNRDTSQKHEKEPNTNTLDTSQKHEKESFIHNESTTRSSKSSWQVDASAVRESWQSERNDDDSMLDASIATIESFTKLDDEPIMTEDEVDDKYESTNKTTAAIRYENFTNENGNKPAALDQPVVAFLEGDRKVSTQPTNKNNAKSQRSSRERNSPGFLGQPITKTKGRISTSRFIGQTVDTAKGEASHATSCNDVLLGRGQPLQLHPGNLSMRKLVASKIGIYEASRRSQKTKLAEQIVRTVCSNGGRFLKPVKQTSDEWIEIDTQEARDKVSYTFRTFRRERKKHSD